MNLYRADFQPVPILRINAQLGCMTIVAATFKPAPAQCSAGLFAEGIGPREPRTAAERLEDIAGRQFHSRISCGAPTSAWMARSRRCTRRASSFPRTAPPTAQRRRLPDRRHCSRPPTRTHRAPRVYTLKISNPGEPINGSAIECLGQSGQVKAGRTPVPRRRSGPPWLRGAAHVGRGAADIRG